MIRSVLLFTLIVIGSIHVKAQYADIAPSFTKDKHRNIITEKMDEVKKRVKLETECEDEITYDVIDTYKGYKDLKKNLPKTIIFKACDQKLTYICVINPIYKEDIGAWYLGTWTLDAVSKK